MNRNQLPPAALAAFVRGNERRAWVFLWLQSGRTEAAGAALAATIRAFASQAARQSMAQWPDRFWRLVAASPLEGTGQWPEPLEPLAVLDPAPRRALLLRLAAGLDEEPAAHALGVDVDTYRQWLEQACPRDPAGAADAQAWQQLAQAVQQAGRDLPPRRLLRIADLREVALSGRGPIPGITLPADPPRSDRRWQRALLVALACAAALAGTWWWERSQEQAQPQQPQPQPQPVPDAPPGIRDPGPIVVEPLPATAAASHAGIDAPADPAPADPMIDALGLLSWYAAGAPESRFERADPLSPPSTHTATAGAAAGTDTDAHADANADTDADADARQIAWRQLDAGTRAQLREVAAALDALPADERDTLRARFAALDAIERRGWLLGPVLGADYPGLHPLLGYVAADERAPLLATLRAMTPEQRARLAELARRAAPAVRDRLRRELMAQPPAQLDAWLERRSQG
ncbi:hypothetical protein [Pseudoxanthomonas koreensis]|uniref:hypothetical protein n=1 Tax=Pseudoxanthomonas koreensis TaxID=266061 RepID=UPI0035A62D85